MATVNDRDVRAPLSYALEESAHWRDLKAEEYSEDTRNARCAAALHAAAEYVLNVDESAGLERLAELNEACADSGIELIGEGSFRGEASQRLVSRYFFDNHPGEPDEGFHEELLRGLYDAACDDLRHLVRDYSDVWQGSSIDRLLGSDHIESAGDPINDDDRRAVGEVVSSAARVTGRIAQLQQVAAALSTLAATAQTEAGEGGRLPIHEDLRLRLVRKQLAISIAALRALGGPTIAAAEKLVDEPPEFKAATVSGVLDGLDEITHALEQETEAGGVG
jgi:hypothetical protein